MNNPITVSGATFVPLITAEQIQDRVNELAGQINLELLGDKPIFVCVLNGAFMFFADLIRRIHIPCELDFVRLTSYGADRKSSGSVQLSLDMRSDCSGKNVVIVEDIVDSGLSIDFLLKLLRSKNPASIRIVTLLHKPASAKIHHDLNYVGFEIPPDFVIGYGLDYNQQGRQFPAIHVLAENKS
jgi:hypoxanthine phosphoribosyltransferase